MSIQNIYDDPVFFEGYRDLRARPVTLNAAIEHGAMEALMPPALDGIRVLDIGCGFGDLCVRLRSLGVGSVLGLDASRRMIEEAKARIRDDNIRLVHQPIETFIFPDEAFDLVVASLVFHYVEDFGAMVRRIAQALRPGGHLVFSVEHPMCTALGQNRWHFDADGHAAFWPVDRYQDEGARRSHWFVDDVIKYHRTVATYVRDLLDAGFQLTGLAEPQPSDESVKAYPDLANQQRRPPFLVMAAQVKG